MYKNFKLALEISAAEVVKSIESTVKQYPKLPAILEDVIKSGEFTYDWEVTEEVTKRLKKEYKL